MRFTDLAVPFKWLARLLTSFSVRTRIIVLTIIPVVGFLANGLTFMANEDAVTAAFQTASRSSILADASRDFKSAVAGMRLNVKDFIVAPKEEAIQAFLYSTSSAFKSLRIIELSLDGAEVDSIAKLR